MAKSFLIFILLIIYPSVFLFSQATNAGIFFQAVARDNYANPAKDRKIYVQASIVQNTTTGAKVLMEEFQTLTDNTGIFSISIGQGIRIGGIANNLSDINWEKGPYFLNLKISITPTAPINGWDYNKDWIDLGMTPFGAVPYALYAVSVAGMEQKINTSDTAKLLAGYAKTINTITPTLFNNGLLSKVNIADSLTSYVTPTQLASKTYDLTPVNLAIASKLNLSDSNTLYITPSKFTNGLVGPQGIQGLPGTNGTNGIDGISNVIANLSAVTGILPTSNGGTGLSILGAPGNQLKVNGAGTGFEFFTPSTSVDLANVSGINTGDETVTSIKTKLGVSSFFSGSYADLTNKPDLSTLEDGLNKSLDIITDGALDSKYPSVKAVKTYVDNQTISSLNGLSSSSQLFAIGSDGINPNIVSASSLHTFNIPMASVTSVAAGLIAKNDFDKFYNKSDFSGDYNDLNNKPSIPFVPVQPNWLQSDNTKLEFIKNKPVFSNVAISGDFEDLSNKPTLTTLGAVPTGRVITINGTSFDLTSDRSYEISTTVNDISLQTNVTGILPITSGGTGSITKNFIDITNNQSVQGVKKFNDGISVGSNATEEPTAIVDINSNSKGFLPPRLTTTQRDAIVNPAIGLTIFNTETNCLEWWIGTIWYNACGNAPVSVTTNGTAAVIINGCALGEGGNLSPNATVNGNITYQHLDVTFTRAGNYNFIAKNNGVTFSAIGTIDPGMLVSGNYNRIIDLRATGTPSNPGTYTYVLSTSPSCTFSRTVNTTSSNGTAVISSWSEGVSATGSIMQKQLVGGVTETLVAYVETIGTYSVYIENNGIIFTGAGTFTSTGNNNVLLTASGTPTNSGSYTFTTNTNPSKSFSRIILSPSSNGTAVVNSWTDNATSSGSLFVYENVSSVTQTIIADVASVGTYSITTSSNGIQYSASGIFTATGNQNVVLIATGLPTSEGNNYFILNTVPSCTFTRLVQTNPSSFGNAIVANWSCSGPSTGNMIVNNNIYNTTQSISANVTRVGTYFVSAIKNGITFSTSGTFAGTGTQTVVLTATGIPNSVGTNTFELNVSPGCSFNRNVSIHPSSNGTAVIADFVANSIVGTLIVNATVSGVQQYITANVTKIGTYSITSIQNGVSFYASGTFTNIGSQSITLIASGMPLAMGVSTFTLNTSPNCSFNRTSYAHPSSNGSAVINSWANESSDGQMYSGYSVSDISQTLIADVASVGTYSISKTVNGVTFSDMGTFDNIGLQYVTLYADGTPATIASNSFTINTTPSCTFVFNSLSKSTNGTAVVSSWTNGASSGTFYIDVLTTGVTKTLVANVTAIGTYDIFILENNISYSSSGSFTSIGSNTINLVASGTPTVVGNISFTTNTSPNVSFSNTVISKTSNGTSIVASYTLGSSSGSMVVGTSVNNVSQIVFADVVTTGTYSIKLINGGITFNANGTFTSTGQKIITLIASGTPNTMGVNTFVSNTIPQFQFNLNTTSPYTIGQSFGGGKIFYIDETGLHGMIASVNVITYDWSGRAVNPTWGDFMNTGALGRVIGSGNTNTNDMYANAINSNFSGTLVKKSTINGYNDWYIPSIDEINKLLDNNNAVGNLLKSGYWYWTSTRANTTFAYVLKVDTRSIVSVQMGISVYYSIIGGSGLAQSSLASTIPVRSF